MVPLVDGIYAVYDKGGSGIDCSNSYMNSVETSPKEVAYDAANVSGMDVLIFEEDPAILTICS